ncbi:MULTISPECIES: universal stress protein [unclassified Streptomyces]|uniref:universal stress protein n=1 Tax=unclassified Streptomyces TaxID=2593676 RepID=UPI000899C1AB|nr:MULTISPECIES: universal stress protein [unclassified Streptomyces]WSX89777.1 universal stress protein [Streptomyces sp. NBC_00891]WSY04256.1 universal stress protein [Streptomyces sp. NBC_00890]WSZ05882.1 universal stress protein [Streptomyces sp. NBC_00869]WSZ26622.1 universal stress protein [Streptomyces sp. NBC_00870]SEE18136.1 Nucleotide-binding universal stress protein, UspA family [Streptomyces sp. 2131.1]
MSGTELPVIAAVDGSSHSMDALDWAAREAVARKLPLLIVHVRQLARRTDQEVQEREAGELLASAVRRVAGTAPGLRPTTLAPLDFPSAALVSLSRDASLVVLGSRGLGGFRSLMLGSNSLATASMAKCPVVIVHEGRDDEEADGGTGEVFPDIVAGVAADESSEGVLDFAFETAAAHPGARLRIVHGWTMFSSMLSGGPVFDRNAASDAAERSLAELTAGWRAAYPQVEVMKEPVNGSATRTLVTASATASLTVIGRRRGGESLGLGLSPVAHTTLTHAMGPVAVVPC